MMSTNNTNTKPGQSDQQGSQHGQDTTGTRTGQQGTNPGESGQQGSGSRDDRSGQQGGTKR